MAVDSPSTDLPELSALDIERAHSGECDNPFIDVLGRHVDVMREHNPTSFDNSGAYIEDLIQSSPYELDICTIIAAWAIGLEDPSRSGMSRTFSVPLFAVHALYEPSRNETAREVTTEFIRHGTLPDSIYRDGAHIGYARRQMSKVSGEMTRLNVYIDGTPDVMNEVSKLARSDSPEDQKRLQELIAYGEKHRTPLLSAVGENVTNARLLLAMKLIN